MGSHLSTQITRESGLCRQKSPKKGSVVLKRLPEIFCRCFTTTSPLLFQTRSLLCKLCGQLLNHARYEGIGFLDTFLRLVDELGLNRTPLLLVFRAVAF